MKKGRGKKVNRTELANVFGVAMNTVDAWVRAGCPYDEKGQGRKPWVFDTADVAGWREDMAANEAGGTTAVDEAALKRRKMLADTIKMELELATAQGLVAPIDQMERNVARIMAEISVNMRNLPARVVSLLIGEQDERRFKQVLLSEIDIVLESCADMDVAADDDEGEEGGDDE